LEKELATDDCFANQGDELFNGQSLFGFGQEPAFVGELNFGAI